MLPAPGERLILRPAQRLQPVDGGQRLPLRVGANGDGDPGVT
jgi:hypothetical protein